MAFGVLGGAGLARRGGSEAAADGKGHMEATFFQIKRVHLRTVHITRVLLRGIEITPARFDLMRIVELRKEFGVGQAHIQRLLGVSAATVSVMLRSLEAIGYVVRERMAHDGRCLLVKLTRLGTYVLDQALFRLIPEVAERMALRGLAFDRFAAYAALRQLDGHLKSMRNIYGDTAPYEDPWGTAADAEEAAARAVPYTHLVDGRIVYGVPAEIDDTYGD